MVMPGICATLLFPALPRPDLAYPELILTLLPAGLTGAVVAAFLAATMVSISSTLSSAASLITLDLVGPLVAGGVRRFLVRAGRVATVLCLAAAVGWAPQLEHFATLWQYLQTSSPTPLPPIVVLFLVGMFWRGANATGAVVTLIAGSACGAALFWCNAVQHWPDFHFLYAAPILFAIDAAILVGAAWPAPGRGPMGCSGPPPITVRKAGGLAPCRSG